MLLSGSTLKPSLDRAMTEDAINKLTVQKAIWGLPDMLRTSIMLLGRIKLSEMAK